MSSRFLGPPYPIKKNAMGYFRSQSGISTIKSDLIMLLLTNFRERVHLPTFGTGLNELLFEQGDAVLEQQARNKIISAISNWEPRVAVKTLNVSVLQNTAQLSSELTMENSGCILMISLEFVDPENIQEVQKLTLEVPLQ